MKGAKILLAFFAIFVSASILIPSPMFPGNAFLALVGQTAGDFAKFLSAIFNGIFYGTVLWLVFVVMSRRFEKE